MKLKETNLLNKLGCFLTEVEVKERYNFSFDIRSDLFSDDEIKRVVELRSNYDRNVILKDILREKLQSGGIELYFWIINEWGGIKGFKKSKSNLVKIERFKNELGKRSLSIKSFNTISSLSKIASFYSPDDYVIYDSRVIFSLNWLILAYENHTTFKMKYFPIPSGRNVKISRYDIKVLINLKHKGEEFEDLFLTKKEAYFVYCDLLKEMSVKILGLKAKSFELEMFLFAIADEEIISDIENVVSVDFLTT